MDAVSVSQLNRYIKTLLETDEQLSQIPVRGEISNYTAHSSGHHYFTLKDKDASLRCVMFRREAGRLQFRPKVGMAVVALGRVSVYEAGGQYQLYVEYLEPDGIGGQYLALEELKRKLAALGYMDASRKRPLPTFPACIGVVTSPTGAAWQDIQKVARSRFAGVYLKLYPALVQGDGAADSIVNAIQQANDDPEPEVLIVGRGGGSAEDLWCFNEEAVAMAIVHSRLPVVSAVGHEIDFSLADLVADVRAATPSAAAELVVPDAAGLNQHLDHLQARMGQRVRTSLAEGENRWLAIAKKALFTSPQLLLEKNWQRWEQLSHRLQQAVSRQQKALDDKTEGLCARLSLLNPAATFSRGYALCYDEQNQLLRDAGQVSVGQHITTRLAKGQLYCQVLTTERKETPWPENQKN